MAFNGQRQTPAVLPWDKELTSAIEYAVPLQDRCRHIGAKLNLFLLPGIEPRFLGCPFRILLSIPSTISAFETQIRSAALYKSHTQTHNPSVDRSHTARLNDLIRKVIEWKRDSHGKIYHYECNLKQAEESILSCFVKFYGDVFTDRLTYCYPGFIRD
jgi:hypothetical protein